MSDYEISDEDKAIAELIKLPRAAQTVIWKVDLESSKFIKRQKEMLFSMRGVLLSI